MTNDIATMQNELRIAKQENEILNLKFELQKVQAQKVSRLEDSLFSPALYDHYRVVAETLAKSGVVPVAYRDKPNDTFVAMAMGYQLGFSVEQALQDIAVINNKPCLFGDGLMAVVLNHPECISIKEEPVYNQNTVTGYTCTVLRKGYEPHSRTFTYQDAERAKLLGKVGPWSFYPERMLQMRARSWALRDRFADALRGFKSAEEVEDEGDTVDVEFEKIPEARQVDKVKKILSDKKVSAKKEKVEEVAVEDGALATDEQLDQISLAMKEKGFDEERTKKALDYFKVDSLFDLTQGQAKVFLIQLSRV